MHPFQSHPLNSSPVANGFGIGWATPIGGLTSLFAAVLRRRSRARDGVLPIYEGHAWCDSIERQLITDGMTGRRVHSLK